MRPIGGTRGQRRDYIVRKFLEIGQFVDEAV